MECQIVFKSQSGNTEMVARTIAQALQNEDVELIDAATQEPSLDADVYFVGCGIYHGTWSLEVLEFLEKLENKRIALFATCGIEPTEKYCKYIERTLMTFMPDECEYLGMYLCQGVMTPSAKEALMQMNTKFDANIRKKAVEDAFYQSLSHPDAVDLENAGRFAERVMRGDE